MPHDFNEQLIGFLPKMRVWALALTRNRAAADDLTQDVATKALVAKDCFMPGTSFSAWLHRIMINHFISSVRNKREVTDMENVPDPSVSASHEERTALRELSWALKRLPPDQREALLMIALDEVPYETASKKIGCAIGTLKSRVHRARQQLSAYMIGQSNNLAAAASQPG
jgi:RNA polymerase sigma-70 factor, ECF subfamily